MNYLVKIFISLVILFLTGCEVNDDIKKDISKDINNLTIEQLKASLLICATTSASQAECQSTIWNKGGIDGRS